MTPLEAARNIAIVASSVAVVLVAIGGGAAWVDGYFANQGDMDTLQEKVANLNCIVGLTDDALDNRQKAEHRYAEYLNAKIDLEKGRRETNLKKALSEEDQKNIRLLELKKERLFGGVLELGRIADQSQLALKNHKCDERRTGK